MGIPETFKSKAVAQDPIRSSILLSFHLRFKNAMKLSTTSSRAEPTFSNLKNLKLESICGQGIFFFFFMLFTFHFPHLTLSVLTKYFNEYEAYQKSAFKKEDARVKNQCHSTRAKLLGSAAVTAVRT